MATFGDLVETPPVWLPKILGLVDCIILMHYDAPKMPTNRRPKARNPRNNGHAENAIRLTVSFPKNEHDLIERLALAKHVSLSWVVREAVRSYLGDSPAK